MGASAFSSSTPARLSTGPPFGAGDGQAKAVLKGETATGGRSGGGLVELAGKP